MSEGRNRMYDEFAQLWELVSPPEEYADEAAHWRKALGARLSSGRRRLLELGVGGGNLLSHLAGDFDAVAVDISPGMLANSRRLNPGVEHVLGDMRRVRLGRLFDAVIAHDAVSYLLTEADLADTFRTAAVHLGPGGVFLTAPDDFTGLCTLGTSLHGPRRKGGTELTYVEHVHDPDPTDSTIEAVYVYFINRGGKLAVEVDRHTTGLFPLQTWTVLMEEAGFVTERIPYPVRDDGREAWLLAGTLADGRER